MNLRKVPYSLGQHHLGVVRYWGVKNLQISDLQRCTSLRNVVVHSTQEQDLSNCSVQNIGNKLLSGACYSLQYPLDMESGSGLIGFIIFKCFGILSSFWFCLPKVMKILT